MKTNLKISGGSRSGLVLRSPPANHVRPTPVRVRKSIFDILGNEIASGPFLDLFSGSGIMAIEAVLRGAPGAVCVEANRWALDIIRANIRLTETGCRIQVVPGNVLIKLPAILADMEFRWIFMDPPYASDQVLPVLNCLAELPGMDACTVITEMFHKMSIPEKVKNLKWYRREKYGDTVLYFWNQSGDNS